MFRDEYISKMYTCLMFRDEYISLKFIRVLCLGMNISLKCTRFWWLGMNILVDPVGFLLINRVPIPEHWSSNISLSSPPIIALLPPPFMTPGVNLSSSGNLANPNIIDFDHQFFRNQELFLFLYTHIFSSQN